MKAQGFMLQQDGSWKSTEIPGPPSMEASKSCWKIYRTVLLMLKHLPNAVESKESCTMSWLHVYMRPRTATLGVDICGSRDCKTTLGDCKRAGTRGQGEVQRAAEVPLEAWEALINNKDHHLTLDRGPHGGALLWIVGTRFLLSEIELACIHLDENCIKLDTGRCLATLKLPVSKTDPLEKGAARTLGCSCI